LVLGSRQFAALVVERRESVASGGWRNFAQHGTYAAVLFFCWRRRHPPGSSLAVCPVVARYASAAVRCRTSGAFANWDLSDAPETAALTV
jgi:hypothetical protein